MVAIVCVMCDGCTHSYQLCWAAEKQHVIFINYVLDGSIERRVAVVAVLIAEKVNTNEYFACKLQNEMECGKRFSNPYETSRMWYFWKSAAKEFCIHSDRHRWCRCRCLLGRRRRLFTGAENFRERVWAIVFTELYIHLNSILFSNKNEWKK